MIAVARWRSFRDVREKAAYMQEGAQRDARAPLVIAAAARFRALPNPWQRARAILQFCQSRTTVLGGGAAEGRRSRGGRRPAPGASLAPAGPYRLAQRISRPIPTSATRSVDRSLEEG